MTFRQNVHYQKQKDHRNTSADPSLILQTSVLQRAHCTLALQAAGGGTGEGTAAHESKEKESHLEEVSATS